MSPSESDNTDQISSAGCSESVLLQALAKRLSRDEKMIRDQEVAEQAKKYFGGLSQRERHLLGMDDIGKDYKVLGTEAETDDDAGEAIVNGEPRIAWDLSAAGICMRALLTAIAFLGVCYWVVWGK